MSAPFDIGPATAEERADTVALLAAAQARPERHICYLSLEPEAIAAEIAALAPGGWDGVLVARRDGQVIGALATEHDREPPRVWWHGPTVADDASFDAVADALLAAGRARLPAYVTEEELAGDDRHHDLARLAARSGFEVAPASAVLSRRSAPLPAVEPSASVRPFAESDRDVVAALHEVAFPASHRVGQRVDEGHARSILVAERDGAVVGYVAIERHEDGTGYIDLVGVDPAARGTGVGATLVVAALGALGGEGREVVHLTVRETNGAARRLYDRLGFTEERLVRPFRRNFALP